MFTSGKRLATRAGKIADIGITKEDLTEEDIAIERGFKEIITGFGPNHSLYGEEENNIFQSTENVWVIDPISSTATFIAGLPHYAIVIAHLIKRIVVFAAVYDPSVDEMFTAYKGKGAFKNGEKILVDPNRSDLILFKSKEWKSPEQASALRKSFSDFIINHPTYSVAIMCCRIAQGASGGLILLAKDSFPEFAGSLIILEAGGQFTNIDGHRDIEVLDRVFIGGNEQTYKNIFPRVKDIIRT